MRFNDDAGQETTSLPLVSDSMGINYGCFGTIILGGSFYVSKFR